MPEAEGSQADDWKPITQADADAASTPAPKPLPNKDHPSNRLRYEEVWNAVAPTLVGSNASPEYIAGALRWMADEIESKGAVCYWDGTPVPPPKPNTDPRRAEGDRLIEQRAYAIARVAYDRQYQSDNLRRAGADLANLKGIHAFLDLHIEEKQIEGLERVKNAILARRSIADPPSPDDILNAKRSKLKSPLQQAREALEEEELRQDFSLSSLADLAAASVEWADENGYGYLFSGKYGKRLMRENLRRIQHVDGKPVHAGSLDATVERLISWWAGKGTPKPLTQEEYEEGHGDEDRQG